jgi:hypothetical protein
MQVKDLVALLESVDEEFDIDFVVKTENFGSANVAMGECRGLTVQYLHTPDGEVETRVAIITCLRNDEYDDYISLTDAAECLEPSDN